MNINSAWTWYMRLSRLLQSLEGVASVTQGKSCCGYPVQPVSPQPSWICQRLDTGHPARTVTDWCRQMACKGRVNVVQRQAWIGEFWGIFWRLAGMPIFWCQEEVSCIVFSHACEQCRQGGGYRWWIVWSPIQTPGGQHSGVIVQGTGCQVERQTDICLLDKIQTTWAPDQIVQGGPQVCLGGWCGRPCQM